MRYVRREGAWTYRRDLDNGSPNQHNFLRFGEAANATTAFNESFHRKAIKLHLHSVQFSTLSDQLARKNERALALERVRREAGGESARPVG